MTRQLILNELRKPYRSNSNYIERWIRGWTLVAPVCLKTQKVPEAWTLFTDTADKKVLAPNYSLLLVYLLLILRLEYSDISPGEQIGEGGTRSINL